MRLIFASALLMVTGLAACDRTAEPSTADSLNAVGANEAGASAPVVAIKPAAILDRLGPIRVGATLAALEREGLALAGRDDVLPGTTCAYASFKGWDDVAVMLDGETVVRIDVSGPGHEGAYGLRVGQSEAEAIRHLGKPLVEPHPYTGPQGHYLIAHEDGAAMGMIVEIDGATVERWRIGQWEQVQWIEGCA